MRLRRKGSAASTASSADDLDDVPAADLTAGPHDAEDVDVEEDATFAAHIDLGGLLVPPPPEGVELRLQVDEGSGQVLAVILAGEEGALELVPFAASRTTDLWDEVRGAIRAEVTRHGGTTGERSGDFGTELLTQVPATAPDGSAAIQPSRVLGIKGARWLLRATYLGVPALEPFDDTAWDAVLRAVVVRRGTGAMPPGEALPLVLPTEAEPG